VYEKRKWSIVDYGLTFTSNRKAYFSLAKGENLRKDKPQENPVEGDI